MGYFVSTILKVGDEAVISHLEGDTLKRCLLSELGFVPGVKLRLVAKMPFGGPKVFHLHGADLAIRHDDACRIFVYPIKR